MINLANTVAQVPYCEEWDYSFAVAFDSNSEPFLWLTSSASSDDYTVFNNNEICCTEYTGTYLECCEYMEDRVQQKMFDNYEQQNQK